ncbi:hypothetical protein QAD02_014644 [Eretmocerus hayati]|uniref:Uncharacterized protein n=1 Tax=Eretmocerus hayati TaxID=131215 RepID=A0ACC2P631_9HYME|nr:hypothetical protein QAD02_014644 [Eretmocerus hayati]
MNSEKYTARDVTTKVIGKNDTIELDCPEGVEKPQWKKGNSSLDLKSQFYMLVNDGATLQITHPPDSKSEFDSVYSNYSCVGEKLNDTKESAKYRVVRPPYVVMPESTIVIEGEKLHLTCAVKSYDSGLSIMWNFKNKNYHTDNLVDRIKLTKDEEKKIPNAVFHLSDVTKDDRVDITCTAFYNLLDLGTPQHVGTAKTLLRVKDKLAALWPFLGICAEVVILCAIILIYEKKRNKSELEESDTDQSPDT